jgi:hypothetical protein
MGGERCRLRLSVCASEINYLRDTLGQMVVRARGLHTLDHDERSAMSCARVTRLCSTPLATVAAKQVHPPFQRWLVVSSLYLSFALSSPHE